jgi:hypothetical protein
MVAQAPGRVGQVPLGRDWLGQTGVSPRLGTRAPWRALGCVIFTLLFPPLAVAQGVPIPGQSVNVTDGSVTGPTVTFTSDNDTGLYRLGTGKVGFSSNGTKTWVFPIAAPTDTYMLVWNDATGNVDWVPNAVTVAGGGTGVTTFGGAYTLLFTSTSDTLTSLVNGTTGQALFATTNAAPSWSSNVARLGANTFTANQAMGGFKITGLGAPTDAGDAVTKTYVDATSSGFTVHEQVVVATVADITLANSQTIGGVALVAPNRVLVKDQTLPAANGCYVVVNAAGWTRCTDFDVVGAGEVAVNALFFVTSGTVNANSSWVLTTAPATVGVEPIVFSAISKSEAITASAPLYRTVNNITLTQTEITSTGTLTAGTASKGFTLDLTNTTKSGTLPVANGGTNLASYTAGDMLYASATTTLSKLANVEGYLMAGGASAPKWVRDSWTVYQGAARCQGSSATSMLNLPSSGEAVPACVVGTNIPRGVLNYTDGGGNHSASYPFYIQDDWDSAGDTEFEIYWNTSAVSGNVIWSVQTACSGTGETTDPAYNAAQTVTTAAQGVTLFKQRSIISALTVTGCSAGETLHVKLDRNGATSGDTIAATASLLAIELVYFRKW